MQANRSRKASAVQDLEDGGASLTLDVASKTTRTSCCSCILDARRWTEEEGAEVACNSAGVEACRTAAVVVVVGNGAESVVGVADGSGDLLSMEDFADVAAGQRLGRRSLESGAAVGAVGWRLEVQRSGDDVGAL